MFDNSARELKEILLAPVAAPLARLHPNVITAVSFTLGLLCAALAWQQYYWLSALFWLLNRITDGLDGTMARVHNKQTDLGGYIDILADFSIYALVPIALVLADPTLSHFYALIFLLGTFYVNAASWMYLSSILEKRKHGAQANHEKTSVTMPPALVGGLETMLIYAAFILWYTQIAWLFAAMGLLVLASVGQRLIWAIRTLRD